VFLPYTYGMDLFRFFTDGGAEASRLWYESQLLPIFAPPSWLFGVAWSIIYPLIGLALAWALLKWVNGKLPHSYIAVFFANLLANFAFSPLQFGLKSNAWAAADILVVLGTLVYLVYAGWNKARGASYLLLPYLAWVLFATVLQLSITYLNW
jgi:translocator protein